MLHKIQSKWTKDELKVILDVRTRWNSTKTMIARFLQLKECIPAALEACGKEELNFSPLEWEFLENFVSALRPFEVVIKGLSTTDWTLLKGEESMDFIRNELKLNNSI